MDRVGQLGWVKLQFFVQCSSAGVGSGMCRPLTVLIHYHILFRFCVSLEKLEGRFSLDNTADRGLSARGGGSTTDIHHGHDAAAVAAKDEAFATGLTIDSPWSAWRPVVARYPWPALRHLDLNGRINCRLMQILVAAADRLETLAITNWPNEMVSGGMAFDDSWVVGLLEANPLRAVRELTIRMDSEHYVE